MSGRREANQGISHDNHPDQTPEPIAIIGIGCRFPGDVNTPAAFWQLLIEGVDAVTDIPDDRLALWEAWGDEHASTIPQYGGFIRNIDGFDAAFFGITPREARGIDPQQRILLEIAWEALEDAGLIPERLAGSATGVFTGIFLDEYWDLQRYTAAGTGIDAHTNTGGTMSVAANRLSYVLDLHGPSLSVDTACSSSLVAVHLACQSLRSGECSLALAGGVNMLLSPQTTQGFVRASMLSPEGRCKAFDARADGYVRSEGAGVLVLKPLTQAEADGDSIYAVILGSAVNQDGQTNGLTVPGQQGQEDVLRDAYRQAGVRPAQVRFVEAHGTGTPVGDPIEASALGHILGQNRSEGDLCAIGSVKTNIGHTEAAAGVAGLIKAALALRHRILPHGLHFHKPNPDIPWHDLGLRVVTEPESLRDAEPPIVAGVNSFGFGGTNAHVVLEEASPLTVPQETRDHHLPVMLPLSARHPDALRDMAQAYVDRLDPGAFSLIDIAATAGLRRTHHRHRLAVTGASTKACRDLLCAFVDGERRPELSSGTLRIDQRPKLVWVFTGMGPQWAGMGQQLLEQEPVFREVVERCDVWFRQHAGWSLLDELCAEGEQSRIHETRVAQPAIFAIQVALASLWNAWGIHPDVVVGHSVGEIAAACAAGALTLEDAARVCFHRSRLQHHTTGDSAMLAVGISPEEAAEIIAPYADRVTIAAINSPISVTLSGNGDAIADLENVFQQQQVFCQRLTVDVAYHSMQMDRIGEEFLAALQGLAPKSLSVPFISTVTGQAVKGTDLDAVYWWRNIRDPVRLDLALATVIGEEDNVLLQIGPHPVLAAAITENLVHLGQSGAVLASLRRDEAERKTLLQSMGTLYTRGYEIDWNALYPEGCRHVPLPPYPWQRQRYWLEVPEYVPSPGVSEHPLLGHHTASSLHTGTHFWEAPLPPSHMPYLDDHRIRGRTVVPAAAWVEMALEALQDHRAISSDRMDRTDAPQLTHIDFQSPLVVSTEHPHAIQVALTTPPSGTTSFTVSSRPVEAPSSSWTVHACGTASPVESETPDDEHPNTIRLRCPETLSRVNVYIAMAGQGLEYGESFQGIETLWRGSGEAIGWLDIPEHIVTQSHGYVIHPVLLDACFQVLLFTVSGNKDTWLPVGFDSLRIYERPDMSARLWAHARLRSDPAVRDVIHHGDIRLLDDDGHCLIEVYGLRLESLSGVPERRASFDAWLYAERWDAVAPSQPVTPASPGSWLVFTDSAGVARALRPYLEADGQTCVMITPGETYTATTPYDYQLNPSDPDDFQRFFQDIVHSDIPPCRGVIHLWSLDVPLSTDLTPISLDAAQRTGPISVLHLIQAILQNSADPMPRLWLVTAGAQTPGDPDATVAVAGAPLWGLGRVLAMEHPELRCTRIDLGLTRAGDDGRMLFDEICADDDEQEIIRHGRQRYTRRLTRYIRASAPQTEPSTELISTSEHPYCLEIPSPGLLENLGFRITSRVPPGPGEVEIRVRASGLNFRDVLSALGLLPPVTQQASPTLGWECVGTVVSIGDGVEGIRVGDGVMAIAPSCFGAYTVTRASLVVPVPSFMSHEEAATIPIAFITAYYALIHLGRLSSGERVLIHSASGGVGLAAVQIAQHVGAEIFATAGAPEKRAYLTELGVGHVMDSRSPTFADEIDRITGGQGVDVVLNSLAGEFMRRSLSLLAPYGRFLELGKTDILQSNTLDLRLFEQNISFFAIDLARLSFDRPVFTGTLLREVMAWFEAGHLNPLPYQSYPIQKAVDAFQYMAKAQHIGKIVVTNNEDPVPVSRENQPLISDQGAYLITGGLGGLGLTMARWLIDQGARHLVLVGRQPPSVYVQMELDEMRKTGTGILVSCADVADPEAMRRVLEQIDRSMPPLRGIIHAAGVLDDGILLQQTRHRFEQVLSPKVTGAWNLHTLTLDAPLDFFVMFSSMASMLGTPGQGNYASANAFLDALAQYRRAEGRPALTINWGPWASVGMAARTEPAGYVSLSGIESIPPEDGLHVFEALLRDTAVRVGVIPIDWSEFRLPGNSRLFTEVKREDTKHHSERSSHRLTRGALQSAAPAQRRKMVEQYLLDAIAQVVELDPAHIDPAQSWHSLGMDSLMAVELRNRTEADLGVTIPVTHFQAATSIARNIDLILEKAAEKAE